MVSTKTQAPARPWLLLLPFPAILLGAFTASRGGAPTTVFATNVVAAVLGTGVVLLLRQVSISGLRRIAVPLAAGAVLLTASTFLFPGLDGVHRWLQLGPVRLHASAIATPWVLLGISVALRQRFAISAALALAMSAVLTAQPDAGQATAFALAASLLLAQARATPWPPRALGCVAVLGLGLSAWLRPDPLEAVPHVEGIVGLASDLAPALGVGAVLALALLLIPTLPGVSKGTVSEGLPVSLGVYIAVTLCAPALGDFPVPVMGAGASPVLGWYMALGILAVWRRPQEHPTP
ncbi:hypothetical protein A176_002946 [Myxococcus hansupus]|uniref:Uncharacterized protein n=1 Tax=Pseudomyxococcus hansupus TaxID=1297742 RepID=A0A0H4WTC0_9BACT|nr:FtsW/RodA/SpoVE family cell cycle protein [Myxococcus hansupus]AKQ66034.1 hypothetical protein A176_002946 [Myxococcus hansupus]